MPIDDVTVSSSTSHGLWTTIWFHVDSSNDIELTSKQLLSELVIRYKEIPNDVNENQIATLISKMFQMTSMTDIKQVNFQLDYTDENKQIIVGVDWGQIPIDNHALFNIMNDSKGNLYKDILMNNDEKIRVTLVKDLWDGDDGLRIQIREPDGDLRQGPEIPAEYVDKLICELKKLKNFGR